VQTDIESLFIGVSHFAKKFDVSQRTVHRRIADGTLPSLKFGRRRLIALQKLLRAQDDRDEANTGGQLISRS
jgi:excisionase family DNA binding protein